MILCAGKNEAFDFAKPIGIGLIESAITLTHYVIEYQPAFLFFVGTAGSYGNYQPFDLLYSHHASNIELGFLNNSCYTPIAHSIEAEKKYVPRETLHSFATVNSSNYITTSSELAFKMLQQGLELENMEFFSVLTVANHFHLPCLGLFVVTNYCNEHAHTDFITNHEKSKEIIRLHVEKNLKI